MSFSHVTLSSVGSPESYMLSPLLLRLNCNINHLTNVSTQIAASFRSFGISDSTTSLLVVKLSTNTSITTLSVSEHLSTVVKGTAIDNPLEKIAKTSNLDRVRKIYKLNDKAPKKQAVARDSKEEQECGEIEVLVIGMMALRGQT